MRHIAIRLLLAMSLFLAACAQEPAPADWCYTYDFALAATNSEGAPITITSGTWSEGLGIVSSSTEIVGQFTEQFFIHPAQISVTVARPEGVTGAIDIAFVADVFGGEISAQGTLPAELPQYTLVLDNPAAATIEGNTVRAVMQSSADVVLVSMGIYGSGVNPFGRNDCAPVDWDTPTPTLPGTPTPAPTGTPIPTLTPTQTLTPSITPTPVACDGRWLTKDLRSALDPVVSVSPPWRWLGTTAVFTNPANYGAKFNSTRNYWDNSPSTGFLSAGIYNIPADDWWGFYADCSLAEIHPFIWWDTAGGTPQTNLRVRVAGVWHVIYEARTDGIPPNDPWNVASSNWRLRDIEAVEVIGYSWGNEEFQKLMLRTVSNATAIPNTPTITNTPSTTPTAQATPSPVLSPTPSRTALGVASWTPSRTPIPSVTPRPPTVTPPPPSVTPPPTVTLPPPPPTVTPPPNTPRPTNTFVPMPTNADGTTTPNPTYAVPGFTGVPGTPEFGTLVGTPGLDGTGLPTLDALEQFHDDASGALGTAVAHLNVLPGDFAGVMPDLGNLEVFAGYGRGLISGVSLQEIFGQRIYPVVQHSMFALTVVIVMSSAKFIYRLVLMLIRFAVWIVRWILKLIPFIG